MISQSFNLALKSLKHRKLRSWLTILGIFIGIAAVVSLISLGQGLRTAINSQFGVLSIDVLTIQNKGTGFGPPGSTVIQKLNDNDIKIIESVSGVKLVITRLIRIAKIEYNDILQFKYAVDLPDDKEQIEFVEQELPEPEAGRLLKQDDKGKIVIGSDFQEFDKEVRVGSKLKIQGKYFEVIGILKPANTFTINNAFLMTNDDLKELFNIGDEVDLIVVKVEQNKITEIALDLERKFRKDRNEKIGEETFDISTPLEALESVNTILNIVNLIVIGIAAISLLVGGIGVANTMYTSVLERTREIGTMKAIGAKNKDILILFLIESGLLGMVGGITGALFGALLSFTAATGANAYFQNNIFSVGFSPQLIGGAIAFSFFIGIISGVIPAYQASRLKPVEALRR